MTLQIAFVGTDGVLLASDQRSNITSPNQQVTTSHLTRKIMVDHDRGLAACWSGYEPISQELARRILKSSDSEVSNQIFLESIAEAVYKDVREQIISDSPYGQVILVNRRDLGRIYSIYAADRHYSVCPYIDWVPSGQNSNPALFFCQKFYKFGPIEGLIMLAAHTILTAGQIDPYRIGGLEILRCTSEKFEFVPREQLKFLQSKSAVLDSIIITHISRLPDAPLSVQPFPTG